MLAKAILRNYAQMDLSVCIIYFYSRMLSCIVLGVLENTRFEFFSIVESDCL